jgi:hypothetical protein
MTILGLLLLALPLSGFTEPTTQLTGFAIGAGLLAAVGLCSRRVPPYISLILIVSSTVTYILLLLL